MASKPFTFQSQGGGGGISIFQDNVDSENIPRGKQDATRNNATKRAPLDVISNTSRVQPFRAAKQPLSSIENNGVSSCNQFGAKTFSQIHPSSQPFSIHIDSSEKSSTTSSSPSKFHHQTQISATSMQTLCPSNLPSDITTLRKPLAAISSHVIHQQLEESPMVLDTSLDVSDRSLLTHEERLNHMLTAADYASDIYKFLREQEVRHRPNAGYMRKQPDVTSNMRSVLVDWLVEVAEEYSLHRETLCLAINYIDRFLSHMSVLRGKLQLVGAASIFLASKYEEIYPPELHEFVYITDNTYTKHQVLRMEHLILKVLSFDIAIPTVNVFCEKYLNDIDADDKTKSLAMYLLELTLLDGDTFLKHLPSQIAASCVCLALHMLHDQLMPECLTRSSEYVLSHLEPCMRDLYTALVKAPQHSQQAIYKKYQSKQFHQVSLLSPPHDLPSLLSQ